jgi:anti-sigma regulatory factor (Ser/Thr protein kinase)
MLGGLQMPRNSKTRRAERSRVEQVRVPVNSDADILLSRQHGRQLAFEASFTMLESTFIATVISELARNIPPLRQPGRDLA